MKQITHINIDIKYRYSLVPQAAEKSFELILSLCKNLTTFNFGDMLFSRKRCVRFERIQLTSNSSLTKMKLYVADLFDLCLILDGRFCCLSTLIITVADHYGPTHIHEIVSIILMLIIREKERGKLNL